MLLRFCFENYRSFQEQSEMYLLANERTTEILEHLAQHEHVVKKSGQNILLGNLVYGANAAGKSNLVKAFDFVSSLVVQGRINGDMRKLPFMFGDGDNNNIGVFQFDLMLDDAEYIYTLAVNYQTASLETESLYRLKQGQGEAKDKFCLFDRDRLFNASHEFEFKSDFINSPDQSIASRFKVYQADYAFEGMAENLFLYDMNLRLPCDNPEVFGFFAVFAWFKHLLVVTPHTSVLAAYQGVDTDSYLQELEQMLQCFDTGITKLCREEVDFNILVQCTPDLLIKDFLNRVEAILRNNNNGQVAWGILEGHGLLEMRWVNGKIEAFKIVTVHQNLKLTDFQEESSGVKQLLVLLLSLLIAKSGSLLVVDNFDHCLHPLAVTKILELLYKSAQKNQGQFILTTHADHLLDLDWLSDDEFHLVKRDKQSNSSSISSLTSYAKQRAGQRREFYLSALSKGSEV